MQSLTKLLGGDYNPQPLKIDNSGPIRMARDFILFHAPCGCMAREDRGYQIINGKIGPATLIERVFKAEPCSREHALIINREYSQRANDYTTS
jgi:hypothetical protein